MPRFGKPALTKKPVPFQREVPPPSPSAGTLKGVDPWSVRQTLGPNVLGNVEGGFGTVVDYAKGLNDVKSQSALKDKRAILEKILIGSQEQSKAFKDAQEPKYGGSDPLSRSLAPIENTLNSWAKSLSAAANTQAGEFSAAKNIDNMLGGRGSLWDMASLPLTYWGSLTKLGEAGHLPKGTIPKVLSGLGMYGAGSIDPKTRKVLNKYIGNPVKKAWDVANTPIGDLLP